MSWQTFYVQLQGTSPLLQNRITEEAIQSLDDKKSRVKIKEVLTPREIANSHAHVDADGNATHPSEALLRAMISVAKGHKIGRSSAAPKVPAAVRFTSPYMRLMDEHGKPIRTWEVESCVGYNRQSATKVSAIRCHYPRYDRWRADFHIKIHTAILTPEFCQTLLNEGGELCGIGTRRPERMGSFGTFLVALWEPIADGQTVIEKIKETTSA